MDSKITCATSTSTQNICLDITSPSGNGLEFQPFVCTCITKGTLRVNEDSDCSTANSNTNADVIYDFGDGTCDGDVDITRNGVTTTTALFSCH